MTNCIIPERAYTDGYVLKPGRISEESSFSYRSVSVTGGVAVECRVAEGIVERSRGIALERLSSERVVVVTGRIAEQSKCAIGCIGAAGGVAQKGCRTSRRIFVGRIEQQCSGPDGRIQLASSDAPKREKTNPRVKSPCRKAEQSILSFGRVT